MRGPASPASDAEARRPRIGITLGDPRGIGPEVVRKALSSPGTADSADVVLVGPENVGAITGADRVAVGSWDGAAEDEREAGRLSGRAVERAIDLALGGEIDGLVTAPLSKSALSAAGYGWPGHTELLRDRTDAPEVAMMMAAEETPAGGPLRMALVTGHIPLRDVPEAVTEELTFVRARIAASALRQWWGIERPRLAFAGLNPHASEGGLFGDEEARVLRPAARRIEAGEHAEVTGIHPADTVFRLCLEGRVDAVVVPYHDLGLAVIKTLALEHGVNVTAGLPFPRTSPDHGTAFDIAGRDVADPRSMEAAIRLCVRFCRGSESRRS